MPVIPFTQNPLALKRSICDVFLGGTCNNSTWRDNLINHLTDDVKYFNPVVSDWNQAAKERELLMREEASFVLYVLTPAMTGVYSLAELMDDSNKRPGKTLFSVIDVDILPDGTTLKWSEGQKRSLAAVTEMAVNNGARHFSGLMDVADFLNESFGPRY